MCMGVGTNDNPWARRPNLAAVGMYCSASMVTPLGTHSGVHVSLKVGRWVLPGSAGPRRGVVLFPSKEGAEVRGRTQMEGSGTEGRWWQLSWEVALPHVQC